MDKWINEIIGALVALVFSGFAFVIRTVLTNASRIQLLEGEMKAREQQRLEDRETLLQFRNELKEELRELRSELHNLLYTKK